MRMSAFFSLTLLVCCALGLPGSAQNNSTDPSQRPRGIELYNQKKYGEAAELLKQAVKKNKSDADAWYYLGLALLQNPRTYRESSKAFETATKLRPTFADAHAGFAYLLLIRNKNDDAAREARAALALDAKIADAYYVLGVTRLRAGAKEEALQNAETAIRLRPQIAPAYLLKSQALVPFLLDDVLSSEAVSEGKKDRLREAAEALEKYLQLIPNDSNRATWEQQLESLRVHAHTSKPGEKNLVFSGREVTTKARVISKPEPIYTEEARANGVTGTVVLRCVLTTDGVVRHCLIVKALPLGLTEQSINAARKTKFVPAMIDGQPVNMYLQLEYSFHLY
jgi:TonB family protein